MDTSVQQELAKHLIVANSPSFVVDVFQNHPSVASLYNRDRRSLLKTLRRVLQDLSVNDYESRAYAYGIAVALFLKSDHESLAISSGYETDDIWFKAIVNMLLAMLLRSSMQINETTQMPLATTAQKAGVDAELQLGVLTGVGQ